MQLLEAVSDRFFEITQNSPAFLHFDAIGFHRLANGKNGILESVRNLFSLVKNKGGNLLVPVYSYSYTKNETYSMKESPSDLGRMSDYLRTVAADLRTTDAIFSYLAFTNSISQEFLSPLDYETFGDKSLIASVFNSDGSLLSVGGKLHYCTEIHFLERMLQASYRINKIFPGQIKTLDDTIHTQSITYYCRDLEFHAKNDFVVSFEKLFADMTNDGLIESHIIDGTIEISGVKFQRVFSFLKKKLLLDQYYLLKKCSI